MSLSNYLLDLYTSVPYPLCWDWVSATVACLSDVSAWRYLNINHLECLKNLNGLNCLTLWLSELSRVSGEPKMSEMSDILTV